MNYTCYPNKLNMIREYRLLMSRLMLLIAFSILWTRGYGLMIEVEDYGYSEGKIRNYAQGSWNASDTDLTAGTNKTWSFSMPSAGYVNNTYHHVQNASGFPNANISATYEQYILNYYSSGTLYYQNTGDDILSMGYTGSPDFVWNPPVPIGLPHYLGKSWTGTHNWAYGTYTVSGNVISEGQISTPLGSFQAILVRYLYQTNAISYYVYQWETTQYGIIAYALTVNDGMLYVLNQAEPNTIADWVVEVPPLKTVIGPNPFKVDLSLSLESKRSEVANVSIYDLRGRLVARKEHSLQGGSELHIDLVQEFASKAAGIYFISIKSGTEKIIHKVTKLP